MKRAGIVPMPLFLFLFSCLFTGLAAEEHLSAELLWDLERVGAPAVSADGQQLLFTVVEYDKENGSPQSLIYRLFTEDDGFTVPMTIGHSPVFSPDEQQIAYLCDDHLFVSDTFLSFVAREVASLPTGISSPSWVGDWIYFISYVWPGLSPEEAAHKTADITQSHVTAKVWTEMPFACWNHFLDEEREYHLFRVPAAGGEIESLTDGSGLQLSRFGAGSSDYAVSPDGQFLAFVANSAADAPFASSPIYLLDLASGALTRISETDDKIDACPLFSPDSSKLAFTRQLIPGFYGANSKLMLHELATGQTQMLHADWDRSATGLVWAPDGAGLYGCIDDAGSRRVYTLPLEGKPRALTDQTSFSGLCVAADGSLFARNESFLFPPRLQRIDPLTGELQRMDSFNDEILEDLTLGSYESVTYTGADGEEVQMWVNYPPGFDRSKTYPVYFLIHGGPHNAITDGFHFRWNAQTFASWGYVTVWPNFHGSSGFGQDFCDSINPDWISKPYADVLAAADWLCRQNWVDASRMVAGGGSYGGYLSSILLGREHPFNALVIHAAVYDLFAQNAADFSVHQTRFGPYWENPELYQQLSPHNYAASFHTPSLVIHGQQDLRVPVGQAFELFRALQTLGIESRLVYYPDECHWVQHRHNSIHWYGEVENWLARFAAPELD